MVTYTVPGMKNDSAERVIRLLQDRGLTTPVAGRPGRHATDLPSQTGHPP